MRIFSFLAMLMFASAATATYHCDDDCKCEGKVTSLTMQYQGDDAADVKVYQKKPYTLVFDDSLFPGELFSFNGVWHGGTLSTEIYLYVDNEFDAKIHTSCSEPIGPGLVAGQFMIVSGKSRRGGELCPVVDDFTPPTTPECWVNSDCRNDYFCDGTEECVDGECISGEPPCEAEYCDELNDVCLDCVSDDDCDNNIYCDGDEYCADGFCYTNSRCCNTGEICSEEQEDCVVVPECNSHQDCDNGVFCDGEELCILGECKNGSPPCDDCDEASLSCAYVFDPVVVSPVFPLPDLGLETDDAGVGYVDSGVEVDEQADPEETLYLSGSSPLSCDSTGGASSLLTLFAFLFLIPFLRRHKSVFVLAFAFAPSIALANGTDRFDISGSPNAVLITDSAKTVPHLQFGSSSILDFAYQPLVLRNLSGEEVSTVIDYQFKLQNSAVVGFADFVEAGVVLPTYFLSGPGIDSAIQTLAVGDPSLLGKVRVVHYEEFDVALAADLTLPLSALNANSEVAKVVGNNFISLRPSLIATYTGDVFTVSGQVGHRFQKAMTVGPSSLGSHFTYSVGAEVELMPNLVSLVGDLYGSVDYAISPHYEMFSSKNSFPLELASGFKFHLGDLSFIVGAGTGLIADYGTPEVRLFAGLSWHPLEPECPSCSCTKEICEKEEQEVKPVVDEDENLTVVHDDRIEILYPVLFEFDRAVIRKESYPVLNSVARVMQENLHIEKLSIRGHTDSVGSSAYNADLSQRRAQAVKDFLVDLGVDKRRLVAVGYGEERPLVPNDTAENRAINRRVEFMIESKE